VAEREPPGLRPMVWLGDSKKNIQRFPGGGAQKEIGDELQLIQFGGMPKNAKPFKGIASGVFEIALALENNAYRTVMAVRLSRTIYILHAFQKKAKSGIKTPQMDIDLIKRRYKEAKELAKNEKRSAKED
jgi:phage-related protein